MGQDKTTKRGALRAVLGIGLTALFLLAFAAPAYATDEHLFDPVLSLTESTVVNAEDEVPDPGTTHPAKRFELPCGTATDPHGDIYVSSPTLKSGAFTGGRIDVFNPQGEFLLRTATPGNPCGLAVDSEGNFYSGAIEGPVELFHPDAYPPTASTTYSPVKAFNLSADLGCSNLALAVDPSNDHFYLSGGCGAVEYGSEVEGSSLIEKVPAQLEAPPGENWSLSGIDVYGKSHDLYAAVRRSTSSGGNTLPSRVLVFDSSDGHVKCEIIGAKAPDDLAFQLGASIAVDQSNGDVYVYSINQTTVYQFSVKGEECGFIGKLPVPPTLKGNNPFGDITVDDPIVEGEAGYESPNEGYAFVTSGIGSSSSHLFAYKPKKPAAAPPQIQGQEATGVTETEAVLRAELNPSGFDTTYHFEYTTQEDFEANEYANATSVPVPEAKAAKGGAFAPVYEPITGLEPGTAYRFRLVAGSCEAKGSDPKACLTVGEGKPGKEGKDASFSTYPSAPVSPPCSNAALRTGPSASLPDCRAYELVTPSDTGGHIPKISMLGVPFGRMNFDTTPVSPDGGSVVFGSNSGALPGLGGGGFFDTYEALRDEEAGWQSHFTGLTDAQATRPRPGGISPDHGFSFWNVEEGKGALFDSETNYAQYLRVPAGVEPSPNCMPAAEPEGRFEWIGCGTFGFEPRASGKWISPSGGHVIFTTNGVQKAVQLEPCAPPAGTGAIYDRTPGGPTHCISLLPGDITPTESADYEGTSADGSAVAFKVGNRLYVRSDNTTTIGIPDVGVGDSLTCKAGPEKATLEYQWLRNGAPIGAATEPTYTTTEADAEAQLQCQVTATGIEGASASAGAAVSVAPYPSSAPPSANIGSHTLITGNAKVGQTLTCNPGNWEASPSFAYQWLRGGSPIGGAEEPTYEAIAADKGKALQCQLFASNSAGVVVSFSAPRVVGASFPSASADPAIANLTDPGKDPEVGDQLSCERGTWSNSPSFAYQWLREAAPIATEPTYTVAAADESKVLQCQVTATNGDGAEQRVSGNAVVQPPPAETPLSITDPGVTKGAVNGIANVGDTLECGKVEYTPNVSNGISRQWLRNGALIAGAKKAAYTVTAEDRETVLQCQTRVEMVTLGDRVAVEAAVYVDPNPPVVTASTGGFSTTFAGLSRDGDWVFYLSEPTGIPVPQGEIYACEIASGSCGGPEAGQGPIQIGSGGESSLVNVSADGSHVYFVSPKVLDEAEEGVLGKDNLYAWDGSAVGFIAILDPLDVSGGVGVGSLGLWVKGVVAPDPGASNGPAEDPSRTTPDGKALVFESHADLTGSGYESDGHSEVYRYDSEAEPGRRLICISCSPTGEAAGSDARLEIPQEGQLISMNPSPVNAITHIDNVSADGKMVFFQSAERLVPADLDGKQDVYEWEAEGRGGCEREAGCLSLISSGKSTEDDYLYAMTPDGHDVFFLSGDTLVGQDSDKTPSIYDARVEGGFPPPTAPSGECLGEACQPPVVVPDDPTPASSSFEGSGNISEERPTSLRCPKGKHKVKTRGKAHCVKRNKKAHHRKNHRANANRRAAR